MAMTRRDFIHFSGLATLGLALACDGEEAPAPEPQPSAPSALWFYVGTYTSGGSEGIYLCKLDLATGGLERVGVTPGVVDPSYLLLDAKGQHLYAVNELVEFEGQPSGAVSAFSIHPQSRALTFINQRASRGGAPCHLELDAQNAFLLVSNYVGGNVAVLPLQTGGGLGTAVDLEQHEGSGPHPNQSSPHAHQARLDAANRHVLVSDLGTDKIMVYRFDAAQGALTPAPTPFFATAPGAGPRHLTFHPNGRVVFSINELNSTVTALAYDPELGTLKEFQTLSTLPEGFTGQSYCADIHVSADGRFLYGSNRGHDSLVVFAIGPDGALTLVEHATGGIHWPRNFALDPTGAFLLVANQRGNDILALRRDERTGRLTPVGQPLQIPSPTCLAFAPAAS